MLFIRPKHTFESVVREIVRGLEEGNVVLEPAATKAERVGISAVRAPDNDSGFYLVPGNFELEPAKGESPGPRWRRFVVPAVLVVATIAFVLGSASSPYLGAGLASLICILGGISGFALQPRKDSARDGREVAEEGKGEKPEPSPPPPGD
jgi:hypothetical protein